jgi:dipeptidyl aminopeptidase/acylaminoacyl peptidase
VTGSHGIEWSPAPTTSGALAFIGSEARDAPAIQIADVRHGASSPKRLTPAATAVGLAPFVEPQTVSFKSEDGVEVHAQLLLPSRAASAPSTASSKRAPAIVFLHGGPVRQMMPGWHPMSFYHTSYELNQYLVARGYAVLEVNYRLGVGYGRAFRHAEHAGPFGASEYRDVIAAARWLARREDVDPARIGAWGGSYGGLLTGLALGRDSATFRAGVDVAGVHDWVHEAPDAVHNDEEKRVARASSPVGSIDTWTSPVLLVHADDDANVGFAQTVDLVQRLRAAKRARVETMVLPDDGHYLELHRSWVELARRAAEFFDRSLTGAH